ncbi:DUF342 domain-containing protein [Variovorax sp. HJSM1_2]|uniref:DUF342 domain-containing protein n=1 Tax=Variovorax sp. HJSM1_2 TaxID=3366263 RepID=UPI003BE74D58
MPDQEGQDGAPGNQVARDGLVLSERDGRVLAQMSAGENRAPLSAANVRQLLDQSGHGDWMVLDDGLDTLLERWGNHSDAFDIDIAEKRDASVAVTIAGDGAVAWLQVSPARGGQGLAVVDVANALKQAGVVFGIDENAVLQACAAVMPAKIEAAFQRPPLSGADSTFELLMQTVADRAPKVNEDGLIDFRELGDIPFVQPGAPLMRRHPATAGVAGCDVRGNPVNPSPGINTPYASPLKGVRFAADDAELLEADVKGQPVRVENGMLVEDVLSLEKVDMNSGNISFDGSIEIKGDVMAHMKIKVTGNIVVRGTVEGAELDAGGDIQINSGIIAHSKVKAAGAVAARFIENSEVSAGTVISVDDMVLQSELLAHNQIIVGIKAQKRGRIVGGNTRTMMKVHVPQIGADDASGVTTVQVGVNPILEAQLLEIEAQISKSETEQSNLKKVVQHLKTNGDKNQQLPRAQAALQHALQVWGARLNDKQKVEGQLATFEDAVIEVGRAVEGSVVLTFGKRSRRVQHAYEAGVFKLAPSGHIVHVDSQGTATVVG